MGPKKEKKGKKTKEKKGELRAHLHCKQIE